MDRIELLTSKEIERIDETVDAFRERLINSQISIKQTAIEGGAQALKFETLIENVARYFRLDCDKMLSRTTRQREYIKARCVICWFLRQDESEFQFSLSRIGELMGGFNHATIINSINRFEDDYKFDRYFKKDVDNVLNSMGWKVARMNNNLILESVKESQ
jgi:chromosomal replication initiation ATPase DnaA